jgi:hypothetical protein
MTTKTARILKEAHPLVWPWCAVTITAFLPFVRPLGSIEWIREGLSPVGFFLGIPLLATLSLGNEFQHRTLSLLLSEPVDRMEIWAEKLSLSVVAALSAALVFFIVWRVIPPGLEPEGFAFSGPWIIVTMASATFWTLVARSTLGGVALNIVVNTFINPVFLESLWERFHGKGDLSSANITVVSIAAFVFLCYAGAMLWLGRRTLARFQVTGGMAGDDLLTAGPDVMPAALAGWFRSRPSGAVLNLIRKEARLLRPLWLISLLAALGWASLLIFGLVPERGSTKNPPFAVGMVAVSSLLIAVLAGSLPLGEERTSGTHSWHLTLPVSARRQWLVKLLMALFAGVVCAALLPLLVLIAGGFLFGSPFKFVDPNAGVVWLLVVSLLTFASFWCACALKGTVRAVLWLFPVIITLGAASDFGEPVARKLMNLVVSRFDPFTDFRFTNAVSNINFFVTGGTTILLFFAFLAPTLLFAVIQSFRLFRTQLQGSTLSVIRSLFPLAIVAFLSGFSLMAFFAFVDHAKLQMWTMFRETHEAIEKIQPGAANLDAAHPLQLTVEDLAKASHLSERTRRWLRDARITVAPDQPHPRRSGQYCCGGNSRSVTLAPDKDYSWYLATIHLASGSHCTLAFGGGHGWGILGGVCE